MNGLLQQGVPYSVNDLQGVFNLRQWYQMDNVICCNGGSDLPGSQLRSFAQLSQAQQRIIQLQFFQMQNVSVCQ